MRPLALKHIFNCDMQKVLGACGLFFNSLMNAS